MNKMDYIKEVDELHASDSLKNSISALKPTRSVKRKRNMAVIAACLAVVILISGAYKMGESISKIKSTNVGFVGDDDYSYSYEEKSGSSNVDSSNASVSTQKLIKTAHIGLETKNAGELIKKINGQVASLNGYTSSLTQNKYSEYLSVEASVCVPSDKLDEFLDFLEKSGTVTSKKVESFDVTDDYTDTVSQIKALETEEKALLGILSKCETVQDTMSVQERLATVRGELESLRSKRENYDRRITYSKVSISISEVKRVKKNSTSFGSQVSERFSESLYKIGQFFRNFSVFILGASPYIVLIGAVAALVILIVRKKKK